MHYISFTTSWNCILMTLLGSPFSSKWCMLIWILRKCLNVFDAVFPAYFSCGIVMFNPFCWLGQAWRKKANRQTCLLLWLPRLKCQSQQTDHSSCIEENTRQSIQPARGHQMYQSKIHGQTKMETFYVTSSVCSFSCLLYLMLSHVILHESSVPFFTSFSYLSEY